MKRVLSLVLALVLVIGLLPVTTRAAELDNGLVYEVCEDHVEITGYTGSDTELVIPAEIEGLPVTVIGDQAFVYTNEPFSSDNLASVVIPDSVTTIGEYAFSLRRRLTSVKMSNSVTTIGDFAFADCDGLENINLPDSLTSIGAWAFCGCVSLTSIVIPDGVTTIGEHAFCNCGDLTGIWVKENNPNYSSDDWGILFDKEKTVLIQAPEAITGSYLIPEGVSVITENAFSFSRLTDIVIPGSVTLIGYGAFSDCNQLTSIHYLGDAPEFEQNIFADVTATAYYPAGNPTWTEDVMQDYGGTIDWVPDSPCHVHEYTPIVTAPTCEEQGFTFYTCACGDYYVTDYVDALGHDFVDGFCIRCGNGNFAPDAEVTRGMFCYALWNYCGSPEPLSDVNPFTDISESDYYYDAVLWVVENGITNGLTSIEFGPGVETNRAQVATWLWRAAGSPTAPARNPFVDVGNTDFFSSSALWAAAEGCMEPLEPNRFGPYEKCLYGHINWIFQVHTHEYTATVTEPTCTEQGYTTYDCSCGDRYRDNYVDALGHDYADGACVRCGKVDPDSVVISGPADPANGMFAPDDALNRGEFFYALWNFYGSPEPEPTANPFTDVRESDYYYDAVMWVMENGIALGTSADKFGPDAAVLRGAAVTWLWRAAGYPEAPDENPFYDVKEGDFFYEAVLWATSKGYMHYSTNPVDGYGSINIHHFAPYDRCYYKDISWVPGDHPHKYTAVVTKPTCTEQGYTTYTCTDCGYSYAANYVDALDHKYTAVVTKPTCTEQGYTTYTCTICEYSYAANYVDALGHDYADDRCTRCGQVDPTCWEPCSGMFAPDDALNRGMFFYALWNFYGSPEPESTENPFTDIIESDYYYDAALWAAESGISRGVSATQFGPDSYMNRAQAATFLWRAAGSPEVQGDIPYTDVPPGTFYERAALWATTVALCMGPMDATRFGPDEYCLYGHINWVPADHTHIFNAVVTEPTCTEQGCTTYTCTICEYGYAANYVDALGHDYADGSCTRCGEADPDYVEPVVTPFTDVPADSFYAKPVLWAVENGITNGTSDNTFSPDDRCLRAHVVTFLWRAAGSPEPTRTDNPFTDVKPADFFYKAVLWAVENEITNGISADKFGSYDVCNRSQVVTFLWRAFGCPEPMFYRTSFTDVKETDFFYKAVLWAVENGITNGMTATEFGPNSPCNRAQVVTFLYRTYNN